MEHTQGEVIKSQSWLGETSEAGVDHDGDKDIFTAKSFVRHENEDKDFTITVQVEDSSQDKAGEQAIVDINRIAAIWNASKSMPTDQAVKYLEHGATMLEELKGLCDECEALCTDACMVKILIKTMEEI